MGVRPQTMEDVFGSGEMFICRILVDGIPLIVRRHTPTRRGFDLREFVFDLTDDAQTIVGIVLDSAGELSCLAKLTRRSKRRVLRDLLIAIGWEWCRADIAFCELRVALYGK